MELLLIIVVGTAVVAVYKSARWLKTSLTLLGIGGTGIAFGATLGLAFGNADLGGHVASRLCLLAMLWYSIRQIQRNRKLVPPESSKIDEKV